MGPAYQIFLHVFKGNLFKAHCLWHNIILTLGCFVASEQVHIFSGYRVNPGRLTWNLQITHLERKVIFQTSMIMFHVIIQGCKPFRFLRHFFYWFFGRGLPELGRYCFSPCSSFADQHCSAVEDGDVLSWWGCERRFFMILIFGEVLVHPFCIYMIYI